MLSSAAKNSKSLLKKVGLRELSKSLKMVFTSDDLFKAVEDNKPDKVKEIVASGVDVHSMRGSNDHTPLHVASKRGFLEVVKTLIEDCSANINFEDDYGDRPVHNAADNGHIEIVRYLVSKNCKNAEDVAELLAEHAVLVENK